MPVLYHFFIFLYSFVIKLLSPFYSKPRLWVKGRKDIISKISHTLKNESNPIIWIHASSLGEFEQGRPVIEFLKEKHTEYKIFLTFFSPSGYEIRKNYPLADYIFYMPADTPFNSRKFIDTVKPHIAIFIKYEYWFNYLNELNKKRIPVFFISAIFRKEHYFFKFYGSWALNRLKKINYFFVQNNLSKSILNKYGINNVIVSGDTRFDRVIKIAQNKTQLPLIEEFAKGFKVIIGGSTWPKDDDLIKEHIDSNPANVKYIIVPHIIDKKYIENLINLSRTPSCKYSDLNSENVKSVKLIVVDSIGLLSSLYAYAHIAYIGGGFGKGIHNILEAACYGIPVLFGPKHTKFSEAVNLIQLNGAFSVNNANDLKEKVNELLNDKNKYKAVSEICFSFVNNNSGATEKIMKKIEAFL